MPNDSLLWQYFIWLKLEEFALKTLVMFLFRNLLVILGPLKVNNMRLVYDLRLNTLFVLPFGVPNLLSLEVHALKNLFFIMLRSIALAVVTIVSLTDLVEGLSRINAHFNVSIFLRGL